MKIKAILLATAVAFTASSAFATGSSCKKCDPPSQLKKVKVNSGVGNGSEFGPDESDDRDPGNSGANNRAGNNVDRPQSPNAGNVIP